MTEVWSNWVSGEHSAALFRIIVIAAIWFLVWMLVKIEAHLRELQITTKAILHQQLDKV